MYLKMLISRGVDQHGPSIVSQNFEQQGLRLQGVRQSFDRLGPSSIPQNVDQQGLCKRVEF